MANITLGPIIGEVNFGEARVVAEFDAAGPVEFELKEGSNSTKVTVEVEANKPALFVFQGVNKGFNYTLNYQQKQIGSFKTLAGDGKSDLRFGLISCNSVKVYSKLSDKQKLFFKLKDQIQKKEIDYALHIGDQVYADKDYYAGDKNNAYGTIEELVKDVSINELSNYTEQAREIIRNEYRKTWSQPEVQFVLANIPNRMILDDHEIKDDAGKDQELQDPSHWKYWYSTEVSRHVYYEYQKRLVSDVDLEKPDHQTHEYQSIVLQNSGIFVTDSRGHFLWHGDKWDKNNSYLGAKQKQALLDSLKDDGQFKDVKSLFIVSAIPMVMLGERITRLGSIQLDDMNQLWEYEHKDELADLLNELVRWKEAKPGRVVSLLSGDVHFGGHYDIYKNNKGVIKQLIASSIGNEKYQKYQQVMTEILAEVEEGLGKGFHFEKHDLVFDNNYGVINVMDNQNGHTVYMGLISNGKGFKQEKVLDSKTYQKKSGGCCSIF